MSKKKEFGLMEEPEMKWDVKDEKVTSVNSAWTWLALSYGAAALAV